MPYYKGETMYSLLLLKQASLVPYAYKVRGFVSRGLRGVVDSYAIKGVYNVALGKG
jgi:hypothetical protein